MFSLLDGKIVRGKTDILLILFSSHSFAGKKQSINVKIKCISFDLFGTLVTSPIVDLYDFFTVIKEDDENLPPNFLNIVKKN